MWYLFEAKPWRRDKQRRPSVNYLNILKATAQGGCLTLAVGWQICCDLCGSKSMVLVLMTDVPGIIFNFAMCCNILRVKMNLHRID